MAVALVLLQVVVLHRGEARHQMEITEFLKHSKVNFRIDLKVGPIIEKGQLLMLQLNIP